MQLLISIPMAQVALTRPRSKCFRSFSFGICWDYQHDNLNELSLWHTNFW